MNSSAPRGAHEAEFDVLADWTSLELIGRDRPSVLAGACRGSGSPAALAWLAESLRLEPGLALLDVGAGLGGPAAWAEEHYGVRPVTVEPMVRACAGSRRLFDHRVLAAAGGALPIRTGSFDAGWVLGVLDTLDDPLATLGDMRRALSPQGRLGVLAYVADQPIPPGRSPEGNHFPTSDGLVEQLADADFMVVDQAPGDALPDAPLDWRLRQDRLDRILDDLHGEDARWDHAKAQEAAFGSLLADGFVVPLLLHAVCI